MKRIVVSLSVAVALWIGLAGAKAAPGSHRMPDYRYDFTAEMVRSVGMDAGWGSVASSSRASAAAVSGPEAATASRERARRELSYGPALISVHRLVGRLIALGYRLDFVDTAVEMGRDLP